jgi:hypothetical protein
MRDVTGSCDDLVWQGSVMEMEDGIDGDSVSGLTAKFSTVWLWSEESKDF